VIDRTFATCSNLLRVGRTGRLKGFGH
jgi:hypothetical protein